MAQPDDCDAFPQGTRALHSVNGRGDGDHGLGDPDQPVRQRRYASRTNRDGIGKTAVDRTSEKNARRARRRPARAARLALAARQPPWATTC